MLHRCDKCGIATRDPVRLMLRVWCTQCASVRLFELEAALFELRASLISSSPKEQSHQ